MTNLRMTQPAVMQTKAYISCVETLDGNAAWSLFTACIAGDLPAVRALLKQDWRLVNAQYGYQLPIHLAVRAGHAKIVKQLLENGADPGQSAFLYNSWDQLLECARERGHRNIAQMLERAMRKHFNYAADFDALKEAIFARNSRQVGNVLRRRPALARAADAFGNNAIHLCVMTRQLPWIERFAKLGTPIDALRADGKTPLLLALSRFRPQAPERAIRNRWIIVGDLLARGARYSMSVAAAVGDQERVEQLLKKDAGLAQRLDSARVSPLSYAAREGHTHIVRLLLEHGANPNHPEDLAPHGRALFEACWGNQMEAAKLLLEHGADPNAGLDSCGCCLTIGEHYHGKAAKPLQQLLRENGAETPPYAMSIKELQQAIRDGHPVTHHEEFLGNVLNRHNAALLEKCLAADPTVTKRMPQESGVVYPQSAKLVRRLLDHGLDPNKPDWLGKTFLHACAENGDRAIAALFLDAGADINAVEHEYNGTPLAAAIRHETADNHDDPSQHAKQQWQMVEFLLQRGAATNVPNSPPWSTPLAWARKRELAEIEAMLIEHGADAG